VSIGSASVWEGTGSAVRASFAVTLREPARVPVSVSYATAGVTASATVDYTSGSGTLNFAVGQASKVVTVSVVGDSVVEPVETFRVTLSSPVNALIGTGTGTGTIRDDDSAAGPNIAVSDASVSEGDAGVRVVQLEIRTTATTFPVEVTLSVVRGSAEDSDFVVPAVTTQTVELNSPDTIEQYTVKPDLLKEGNERFGIFVSSSALPVLDSSGAATIVDNDLPAPPASPLFSSVTTSNVWTPPSPLPAGAPGDVIWSVSATGSPTGATARTMLYRSRTTLGSDVAVSAWVIVPNGTPPAGGWPIVAWNHPTSGMPDSCAPTRSSTPSSIPYISDLVARHYMIVATDYVGLGTPGNEPYLAAEAYAHAVLDGIRAARKITPSASNHVVLYGWSEGGIASAATTELWPYYAPELDLRGAVGIAAGVAPTHAALFASLARNPTEMWEGLVLQGVAGLDTGYPGRGYPSYFLTSSGIGKLPGLQSGTNCYPPGASSDFQPWLLNDPLTPPAQSAAMAAAEERGWITTLRPAVPVLLVHGRSDTLVTPQLVAPVVRSFCDRGANVGVNWYTADHFNIPTVARTDVLAWIDARITGTSAPNACDNSPPTTTAIAMTNRSPTSASTVNWNVTFSEPVLDVTAANFSLASTGPTASITSVTGSGSSWILTADTGSGDGTLGLDLSNPTGITDYEGNPLAGPTTGDVYSIDRTAPNVLSVLRADPNPTSAPSVSWTVTFDEDVTGVDATAFTLTGTAAGTASITTVNGSGTTWTVTADVSDTGTLGLDLVDGSAIADAADNPLANTATGESYDIQ